MCPFSTVGVDTCVPTAARGLMLISHFSPDSIYNQIISLKLFWRLMVVLPDKAEAVPYQKVDIGPSKIKVKMSESMGHCENWLNMEK